MEEEADMSRKKGVKNAAIHISALLWLQAQREKKIETKYSSGKQHEKMNRNSPVLCILLIVYPLKSLCTCCSRKTKCRMLRFTFFLDLPFFMCHSFPLKNHALSAVTQPCLLFYTERGGRLVDFSLVNIQVLKAMLLEH